jgi:O-antigen/teichoic acid export membrane protein
LRPFEAAKDSPLRTVVNGSRESYPPGLAQATDPGEQASASAVPIRAGHERIGSNILANWFGYGVGFVVGFFLAPIMVHRLGDLGFGIWAFALQLGGYMGVFDLGVRAAVSRYITHHHARNERPQVELVLSVGTVVQALFALPCLLTGGLIAYYLPHLVRMPLQMSSAARWTVCLIGVEVATGMMGWLFTGALAAVSRYDLINMRRAITVAVRGVLIWQLLVHGFGLLAVAVGSLLTNLLGYFWEFGLVCRVYQHPHFHINRSEFATCFRLLFSFSVFTYVIGFSNRLIFWTDNLVVGAVLGASAVTFYAIGASLVDLVGTTLGTVTCVFVPLATTFDARGDHDALRQLLIRGSRLTLLLILPGIIGFEVLGAPFISLWMGARYVKLAGGVLMVLSLCLLFGPMRATCNQILYGMNRLKFFASWSFGEAVVNLGLSILLVYKIGIVGVAWGTLIPAVLVEGLILPRYTAKQIAVRPTEYYWQTFMRPILTSLPYAGLLLLARWTGLANTWMGFFSSLACGLTLYAMTVWFFALPMAERQILSQRALRTWSSVSCALDW